MDRYVVIQTPSGWLLYDNLFRVVVRRPVTEPEARILCDTFQEVM